MTGFEILIAAAPVATVTATPAFAYSFMDEYPEVFQAMHPERDVLNGGTLTPAGRMGLELPYGAAPVFAGRNAYLTFGSAPRSFHAKRHR
jgi:hypothetical protein